ncbi:MAG: hypothetical protein PHZ00_01980 [Candidatus Peribacteraceae bacterium]|nr:hypothetical protein [Candidatus Peribacteraceae bacterium]
MDAPLPASALPDSEGAAMRSPRKRGPKAQPMKMTVTYIGQEGWDYKQAIYPMMREWGVFERTTADLSHS